MTEQNHLQTWESVLWREWHFGDDKEYTKRVLKLISGWSAGFTDKKALEWQGRPYATEVEAAIRQACRIRPRATYSWDKRLRSLDTARRKPGPVEPLLAMLRNPYWPNRFVACHRLVDWGGEAVGPLRDVAQAGAPNLQPTARWLLESIGFETTQRLSQEAERLLCPRCLVFCVRLEVSLKGGTISYYGCELCGQSRNFRIKDQEVVVVLDQGQAERVEADGQIRENWLHRRELFYFDSVEIMTATDEEVERFAVQIGNDPDPMRQAHYRQVSCTIAPSGQLSENTIKILRRTFGEVKQN